MLWRPFFVVTELSYFQANPNLWDIRNIPLLFTGAYASRLGDYFYYPLPLALYMLQRPFFGSDPTWFRGLQLALLWAASGAMALLEQEALGPWAWGAALLYVLHPLNSELTLVGVRDQLVALLCLSAVACRRRWAKRPRLEDFGLAVIYALALMSKETGLLLPFFVFADDVAATPWKDRQPYAKKIRPYVLMAGVAAAYLAFRSSVLGHHLDRFWGYAQGESLRSVALRLEYLMSRLLGCAARPLAWRAAVEAAFLCALIWIMTRTPRKAALYAAWLLPMLLVTAGGAPVRDLSVLISETGREGHRLFLPMAGLCWLLALALKEGIAKRSPAALAAGGAALMLLAAGLRPALSPIPTPAEAPASWSVSLPAYSYIQRRWPAGFEEYRRDLWRRFKGSAPAIEAYYDGALEDPCRSPYILRAAWAADEAAFIKQAEAGSAFLRGCWLSRVGLKREALDYYEEALRLDPDHVDAWRQKAQLLQELKGRPAALEALANYRLAMARRTPGLERAQCSCGEAAEAASFPLPKETGVFAGHSGVVYSVAFSPNGRSIASAGDDRTVRLWDLETGRSTSVLAGHSSEVLSIAFSPDEKTLASAGADKLVRLWDTETGQETARLPGHSRRVFCVAFSPDGRLLASASGDGTVRLWNPVTGQAAAVLKGADTQVLSLAFSPDGRTLASGNMDQTIRLWKLGAQSPAAVLKAPSHAWAEIRALAFSPDGKTLASGDAQGRVRLWDPRTGKVKRTLSGHIAAVHAVAFSPNGRVLASGGMDDTIRFWDAATGKALLLLPGPSYEVESLSFSPDGRSLASATWDHKIHVYAVEGL